MVDNINYPLPWIRKVGEKITNTAKEQSCYDFKKIVIFDLSLKNEAFRKLCLIKNVIVVYN